jgi:hypothetical protein
MVVAASIAPKFVINMPPTSLQEEFSELNVLFAAAFGEWPPLSARNPMNRSGTAKRATSCGSLRNSMVTSRI